MSRRRENQERFAIGRLMAMGKHQESELTPTMMSFSNKTHELKIESDAYGLLTVSIRAKGQRAVVQYVRLEKKHHQGAVWTYMGADQLCYLAVEPEKFIA